MIVKVANKTLKQPMEIYISDEEWVEIEAIENKEELNARLSKIALKQVSQHGYAIGYCGTQKRQVTLRDCMNCGVEKGWGQGIENYAKWEQCKKENINYKFMPHKPLFDKVDEKLLNKMKPESKHEAKADAQSFAVVEKAADTTEQTFEKQSDTFMENVRKTE